ncbi:transglycosylase domain-containing protein [Halobacteriovorax marinus]|uniref:transglycosylase domain-containing protein n=1 Tax=Halobacteriovorax marinus TaxID=97084 RepID=UPI003A8D1B74
MKKHKKTKVIIALILLLISLSAGYIGISIPFGEINKLQKGFVKSTYSDELGVQYTIVDKRPKGWSPLKSISPNATSAIMLSEDWDFFRHVGVDVSQIKEAALDGIKGEKLRGASTISQQLTKNLFFSNDRSLQRKLKELGATMYLENKVSKEKILELYLNVIQYGDGIYGIKDAAKHYFNKSPKSLTAKEGAFLAMLLPSPVRYAQSFKEKKLTEFADETVNNILDKMALAKVISKEKAEYLKKQKLNFEKGRAKSRQRRNLSGIGNRQRVKKLTDGRDWENRYKYDPDLSVAEEVKYDPDAINEDDLKLKEEFSLE